MFLCVCLCVHESVWDRYRSISMESRFIHCIYHLRTKWPGWTLTTQGELFEIWIGMTVSLWSENILSYIKNSLSSCTSRDSCVVLQEDLVHREVWECTGKVAFRRLQGAVPCIQNCCSQRWKYPVTSPLSSLGSSPPVCMWSSGDCVCSRLTSGFRFDKTSFRWGCRPIWTQDELQRKWETCHLEKCIQTSDLTHWWGHLPVGYRDVGWSHASSAPSSQGESRLLAPTLLRSPFYQTVISQGPWPGAPYPKRWTEKRKGKIIIEK